MKSQSEDSFCTPCERRAENQQTSNNSFSEPVTYSFSNASSSLVNKSDSSTQLNEFASTDDPVTRECPLDFADVPDFLSKERVKSSIPCTTGEWFYPSPYQFFKSATAKGHSIDPADVPMVVAIHNLVNEQCWARIMEYEKLHYHSCPTPKLMRFNGKVQEVSIKARIYGMLGYEGPFDRHDWFVDRCGKSIRYLVDFYDGARGSVEDMQMGKQEGVSIFIDARPEVTLQGWWDRSVMLLHRKRLQLFGY